MILAQWEQLTNPGSVGVAASIAIVALVVWNLIQAWDKMFRLKPELKKWREETMAKAAETLTALQNRRTEYNDAIKVMTAEVQGLMKYIEGNDRSGADEQRNKCCAAVTRAIERYIDYAEFAKHYYESRPAELEEFITDDVVNIIRRFKGRVQLLNSQALLDKIDGKRSPLVITRPTLVPFVRLPAALPADRRDRAKSFLNPSINELLEVGREN